MSRNDVRAAFLEAAGWADARVSNLAGDASNRRYYRVSGLRGEAVLMDAPEERGEDISLFLDFTSLLRDLGLSAPEIIKDDPAAGFALLEDLGDDLYARVVGKAPSLEREIYAAAVDLLVHLHARVPPTSARDRRIGTYDADVLLREASLVMEWWLPAAGGADATPAQIATFAAHISEACALVATRREALVLRDYHAENLLWLPGRQGHARVGLLDYQDALIGARAYDLVSLLEDARRDTSAALREAMIGHYVSASGVEEEPFRADYAVLGAQRNLKIIGIFARLWLRDGKNAYLDLIPRVWAHLQNDLAHPTLDGLAMFVRETIPPPSRSTLERVRARGA